MNCSEFRKALDNYVLLDDGEIHDIECHAALCEQCRNELEFYRAIIQTAASVPFPDPPADLIEKINERIDHEPKAMRTFNHVVWNVRNHARRYATIAACLVVGLAVGLNGEIIRGRLSGGDDSGVISESTVVSGENEIAESGAYETAAPSDSQAAEESTMVSADHTEAPMSVAPAKITAKAPSLGSSPAPVIQTPLAEKKSDTGNTVLPQPVLSTVKSNAASDEPIGEAVDLQPVVEATETVEASPSVQAEVPVATERTQSVGKYTIARENYYLPEEQTAAVAETTPDPETYGITKEAYQIAQGDYGRNAREVGVATSASIADRIIINSADAEAVQRLLGEMGIPSTNGLYTSTDAVFYELLSRLDGEGIEYDYTSQYNSGERVVFKIVLI